MPFVFIHGVTARPGPRWEEAVKGRHSLMRKFALPRLGLDPASVHFEDPMWGAHASSPAWNNASLPKATVESLGDEDDDDPAATEGYAELTSAEDDPRGEPLLRAVRQAIEEGREADERQPLEDVVDALWIAATTDGD